MPTTAVNIRDKIKAALDTLISGGRLQQTFAYLEPVPKGFPCAMVDIYNEHNDPFLTSSENLLTYRFLVHVQITGKNDVTQSDIRLNLMDDVIDLFSTEPYVNDLQDICDIVQVEKVTAWNADQSESPKIGFDIVLACSLVRSTA